MFVARLTGTQKLSLITHDVMWDLYGRKSDIEVALDDEDALSPSERILRGDFDA